MSKSVSTGLADDSTPNLTELFLQSEGHLQLRETMSSLCFYGYFHKYEEEETIDAYT